MFLKFHKIHRKTHAPASFSINLARAQVFSCEFCEIFKNNFFYKKNPVAASDFNCFSESVYEVEIMVEDTLKFIIGIRLLVNPML